MSKSLLLAGVFLALPTQLCAQPEACANDGCLVVVQFASASYSRSYGLLIAAPQTGCRRVRFRVSGDDGFLGQTPALGPGELAVVRMGRGFPEGRNQVTIAATGCKTLPAATRRVTFAKASPDHGWRASGD